MKKNTKPIVWVINQFAGTLESGWGERHFYFSKHWVNEGYDVRIISGSFNHMFKLNKEVKDLYAEEVFQNIKFIWVKTPTYNPQSWQRFLSMLVFSIRILFLPVKKIGRPDVVIVSSMPIFPILSAIIMRSKWKFNLIFEIRDIWPLTLQLLGNKPIWHPAVQFIGWFERIGYKQADAVVSLLPNARKHMESIAKKNLNLHYIPNGIEVNTTIDATLNVELADQIPKNKFIVGYAGTIGLANALEHLIDASRQLVEKSDIYFVIVGDGYLKNELIEKTTGQKNILFLPKIPKNQVQHLLSFFDVCFVGRNDSPLFLHGVSANKYFDYMQAAKPILNSNNLIKDPVELSSCGLIVKPDSAEAICQGIITLYSMTDEERQEMGNAGKVYVNSYHNLQYLANQYITLFKSLLI